MTQVQEGRETFDAGARRRAEVRDDLSSELLDINVPDHVSERLSCAEHGLLHRQVSGCALAAWHWLFGAGAGRRQASLFVLR